MFAKVKGLTILLVYQQNPVSSRNTNVEIKETSERRTSPPAWMFGITDSVAANKVYKKSSYTQSLFQTPDTLFFFLGVKSDASSSLSGLTNCVGLFLKGQKVSSKQREMFYCLVAGYLILISNW